MTLEIVYLHSELWACDASEAKRLKRNALKSRDTEAPLKLTRKLSPPAARMRFAFATRKLIVENAFKTDFSNASELDLLEAGTDAAHPDLKGRC